MKDSGYDHFGEILPKRSAGYELGLGEVTNAPYLDMGLPFAAGSLYSTVEDLYKWDQALYTDKLLPVALKQRLFTPGLEHYGYGWGITTIAPNEPGAGQMVIAHNGGINGFNTLEQRLVGDHDLIVLLNNTPGADLDEMANGIRAILYGQEAKPPKLSLASALGGTIIQSGVEAGVARYKELKRSKPDSYDFGGRSLNGLGYLLLANNRIADAIAILKLNVEEFPKTGNVYSSLAEAYEKSGQKQLAIENYRKSLAIDPADSEVKDRLKALEAN
jgi:tetratricopeptide (TPR) repeat protein